MAGALARWFGPPPDKFREEIERRDLARMAARSDEEHRLAQIMLRGVTTYEAVKLHSKLRQGQEYWSAACPAAADGNEQLVDGWLTFATLSLADFGSRRS